MTSPTDLERLDELLGAAAAGLELATGGAAVCTLSKAGTPVPGVKYHEGRWAALNELARRCRRSGEDPGATAAILRSSWAAELERLTARGAGPDWIAYRVGGVDALAELAPPDSPG